MKCEVESFLRILGDKVVRCRSSYPGLFRSIILVTKSFSDKLKMCILNLSEKKQRSLTSFNYVTLFVQICIISHNFYCFYTFNFLRHDYSVYLFLIGPFGNRLSNIEIIHYLKPLFETHVLNRTSIRLHIRVTIQRQRSSYKGLHVRHLVDLSQWTHL